MAHPADLKLNAPNQNKARYLRPTYYYNIQLYYIQRLELPNEMIPLNTLKGEMREFLALLEKIEDVFQFGFDIFLTWQKNYIFQL
jgi:hypothetical protein